MFSMILSKVIHTMLDPEFIFLFHVGVREAAAATVIDQVVSFYRSLCGSTDDALLN